MMYFCKPLSLFTRTLCLLATFALFAGPAMADDKKAEKEKPILFHLALKGPYLDLPEQGMDLTSLLLGGGGGSPKSFFQLLARLDGVKGKDNHLLLDLSAASPGLNMAQMSELERTFTALKERGVKTTAWLTSGSAAHFQVACMCDKIYMADMGALDLAAPAMQSMFYKDVFELIGIRPTAVRCGDFKGAVEPYLRSSMSKHLRDHYKAMLTSFNKVMVKRIAKARGLKPEKVRELQGKRIFLSAEAKALGLIDGITQYANAKDCFRLINPIEMQLKSISQAKKKTDFGNPFTLLSKLFRPNKEKKISKDSVVVLHLSGTITDGEKDTTGSIVSGPTTRRINKLAKEDKVKAVVLRINSPGGSATASERILLALRRLAHKKPVVVSMGSMAASGGYYIACLPSASIYAEPATLTGSIGVFGLIMNFSPLARRLGVKMETVGLDPSAGWGDPFNSVDDDFLAFLQKSVNSTYHRFLSHVTLARRIPRKDLLNLAGGRVWSGAQALESGLVDKLGGLFQAIDEVTIKAGLKKGEFKVRHLPTPRNPLSLLTSDLGLSLKVTERLPATLSLLPEQIRILVAPAVRMVMASTSGKPGSQIWAMMPMSMQIK